MDMASVGKKIREKRLSKSWEQETLAEKTQLTATYIGMIERGEKTPRLATFVRIVNALDTTADELLEGVTNKGFLVRMSKYTEKIEKLSKEEQNKIFDIIDIMLR